LAPPQPRALGTLAEPIVGAPAFSFPDDFAQRITERKLLVEGVVILAGPFPRWPRLPTGSSFSSRARSRSKDFQAS